MAKLQEYLMTAQERYSPFMARVPRVLMFEGRKGILIREDGSIDDSEPEPIQARIEINIGEIEKMTPQDVIKKFDDMAKEMGRQATQNFLAKLNKIVEEVGNVLSAKGKPISVDLYLAMLERIEIPFDENLQPILPVLYTHPNHEKNITDVFEKLEKDEVVKARYEKIIAKKREQWLASESNRELVG